MIAGVGGLEEVGTTSVSKRGDPELRYFSTSMRVGGAASSDKSITVVRGSKGKGLSSVHPVGHPLHGLFYYLLPQLYQLASFFVSLIAVVRSNGYLSCSLIW